MINEIILLLGIILAVGYTVGRIISRIFHIPGVVGYILTGILLGPSGIDIIAELGLGGGVFQGLWDFIVILVLGFIGLLIGLELSRNLFKKLGKSILGINFGINILSFFLVFFGIFLYTHNLALALLLGALATSTAPAGKVAVIKDLRAKGPISSSLMAYAGISDILTIIIFTFALAGAKISLGWAGSGYGLIATGLITILGSFALGGVIGGLFSLIEKTLTERKLKLWKSSLVLVLVSVILGAGIAEVLGLSSILTCMAIGMGLINLFPKGGISAQRTVDTIMPPVYVFFFTMAGIHLRLDLLFELGLLATIYVVFRSVAKIFGAPIFAKLTGAPPDFNYIGLSMLSQAGVALGLAAFAISELTGVAGGLEIATSALTVIIATDIVFEIIGPVGTKVVLDKAGESGKA